MFIQASTRVYEHKIKMSRPTAIATGEEKTNTLSTDEIYGRIAGQAIIATSAAEWSCKRCTLINQPTVSSCSVCRAPRHSRLPTLSDVDTCVENSSVIGTTDKQIIDLTLSDDNKNATSESDKIELPSKSLNTKPKGSTSSDDSAHIINVDEEWKCKHCTFNCNPDWEKSCQICKKPKTSPPNSQRSSISPPSPIAIINGNVSYTHRPNDQSPIQHPPSQSTWNCSKCTFTNTAEKSVCSMCLNPRSLSDLTAWTCDYCTVINNPVHNNCTVCCMPRHLGNKSQVANVPPSSPSNNHLKQASSPADRAPFELLRQESSLVEDIRIVEEKEASELRQRIIQHCKSTGDTFVDDSFPPAPKSLFLDLKRQYFVQETQSPNTKLSVSNIQWVRPQNIVVPDGLRIPWVVYRTPMPEDISQGILGNCWFFSALAVLAERCHLVEHIVISKEMCKEGVYQVRLCKDGLWKTILIDDYLPCNSKNLIFAQARRRQLWVPFIEKAMAKLYGSYEALVAGKCIEGLATLTGAPCESIPLQAEGTRGEDICADLIWAKLLSCRDLNFLMGASCGGGNMNAKEEDFAQVGLRSKHSYSILDIQDLEGNKLVRLRNPWGRYSWKGAWSDDSPKWKDVSEASRNKLLSFGEEHGVFWMEFSDLMRYFDSIDVCKIRPGWEERRIQGAFPINGTSPLKLIKLSIFHTTEVELGLFQESSRGTNGNKFLLDLCIEVLKETQNAQLVSVGKLVVHSSRQLRGFVGCHHMFSPGEYILVPLAFNQWRKVPDLSKVSHPSYVLTVHSSKKLMVTENICDRPYLLCDALIQLAVTKGSREELRPGVTAYSLMKGWAGCIFVVENCLESKSIHLTTDCTNSMNIVSTRETLTTMDIIPPFHRQVILILSHLERTLPYHLSRKLIHRPLSSHELPQRRNDPELSPESASLHKARPYV
ncbi:calpain-D-like [Biomphalaria glabrata]|uniref:Calpain-D-like n=1 Tax=Biomphalaria glabrata TaxID=6526 RepID=A0A9W3B120_BIOGL|nr:calpain-D-like [Biomphalaria glabrata]XP_055893145.1 calpain-D-like [Biomphalaria glabrata]XP_055893146.1 calpain-D-like [Biomphalaria glabrata]XP_055893147.1 calpain-D-like [Biomphalaria glabrata]XP_055893148.1 calpain-D-like [Biomphalaria glabrata]